jgi:hypothetical protein
VRLLGPSLLLLLVAGCSAGSGSSTRVEWSLTTDFTLDERASGNTVTTGTGLYFRVEITNDDPDCSYWELSFYDGLYFEVADHWNEQIAGGSRAVWILHTRSPGDTWLEFDRYPCGGSASTSQVTYLFEIY